MSEAAPRRPRVILVAHDIRTPGGMERVYTELIRRAAWAVDFVVVSATLGRDLRGLVEWRRVAVPPRPLPLKFCLFYLLAAIRTARAHGDIVHTVGAIIPNRVDVATVQHCHAAVRPHPRRGSGREGGVLRGLNRWIGGQLALLAERWSYRPARVQRLTAASLRVANEVRRHYPGVPVAMTPNGVDADRFTPNAAIRSLARRREGLNDDEVVALFVGGDWRRKGLAEAIRGLSLALNPPGPSLQLWVVGRGNIPAFRAIARKAGVERYVKFFDRIMDVEPAYQAADLFLLPSHYEGFSLVAFEAAAFGLPVVATPVGSIDELVGADEAGIIVDGTPHSIGTALRRLATESDARLRLGVQARRRALAYSWDRCVDSHLALYRQLARTPVTPALAEARP